MENKLVNNLKAGLTNHKGKVIAVSVLVLILVGVIVSRNLHAAPKSHESPSSAAVTDVALATAQLNKTINVTATTVADKSPVKVDVTLTDAELKNQIKYKDNPINTDSDKQFLLIKLEINNTSADRLAIASGDLIRLTLNNKPYAPDYHNGTIVVEPISVRPDQVVFVVDKNLKDFNLSLGDPGGKREDLEIKFN